MKKFFVMMALVAFATTAMANPFSDVPFTHWAYDAVAKLSARGIITGFPDGSFKGNKTMTRYELAMVVARLMARTEDGRGTGLTKGDYATLERLTVEFADELALLGVKVTALEDEVAMVRDDLAALKHESSFGHCSGQGKVRITGELRATFENHSFDGSNGSYVPGDRSTNDFSQMARLYIDTPIDEDVTYHIALQYGFDDWGFGTGVNRNYNTGFEVKRAYVKINDFFGWADTMIIGRQPLKHVNDLLYFPVEMDGFYGDRYFENFLGGFKFSAYGVIRERGIADNKGLNLWSAMGDFDINHDIRARLYYVEKLDHNNLHNPSLVTGFEYTNNGQFEPLAYAATYTANVQRRTNYIGLGLNGTFSKDFTYYVEYAQQDWGKKVINPEKTAGGSSVDNQYGYILGLDYVANDEWTFNLKYRYHEKYFEPLTATKGAFANGLNNGSNFGEDLPTMWSLLGYTRDFSDFYARANYKFNDKATSWFGYEQIQDQRKKFANEFSDDINVWSIGLKYFYKKNTFFQVAYYNLDGKDARNGAFPVNSVGATNRAVAPNQNLHIGNLVGVEEDQEMLKVEMQIRF